MHDNDLKQKQNPNQTPQKAQTKTRQLYCELFFNASWADFTLPIV